MRFREKTRPTAWYWLLLAGCNAIIWFCDKRILHGRHTELLARYALIFVILGLLDLVSQQFVSWEMDSASLRKFWFGQKVKEFFWDDIVRIGLANYTEPHSSAVQIDYFAPGTTGESRALRINPAEREVFIEALERFAIRARIDVERST